MPFCVLQFREGELFCNLQPYILPLLTVYIVKPVLRDYPIGHKHMMSEDRWSLVTGSVILKCRSLCQKWGGGGSLMAVVSLYRLKQCGITNGQS